MAETRRRTTKKAKRLDGEVKFLAVGALKPHPKNSRRHGEDQIRSLCKAIQRFGFNVPIVTDDKGTVLAGHARLEAAKELKMDKVPVVEVGHLTATEKRAFIVADNKLAERAEWDDEALAAEVALLNGLNFDMDVLGFEAKEVADILEAQRLEFLGDIGDKAKPGSRQVVSTVEFVQMNFTLTPDQRKTVMDKLRKVQQAGGLSTAAEALVSLCEE